ncbi:MAG: MFS transporter [Isosphaeraceae bacterium]
MHFNDPPAATPATGRPWYDGLTRYHWFVLVVASLGWAFDTMDQQLFTLARTPALSQLLNVPNGDKRVADAEGIATTVFMIGWAVGGVIFGILGDRIGRARTMMLTILLYSMFTGLSALSRGLWDFAFYRFLTGLGVGGEFAVGVALVAEVMPDYARPRALGWVQAMSAIGNMIAAIVGIILGTLQVEGAWRVMFLVGALPALLTVPIFRRLKEPEAWTRMHDASPTDKKPVRIGSISELFGDPRWRRNTLAGMLLAFAGVVGLWGIGFFSPRLVRGVFEGTFRAWGEQAGYTGDALKKYVENRKVLWTGINSLLQNFGAFWGVYAFSIITTRFLGRKSTFAIFFVLAMASTISVFWFLNDFSQIFWMIPIMGFCQIALFGGYAIYFPELYPTRLRSTGTSFCYNVGRLVAASGPLLLGKLESSVFQGTSQPLRYAGVTMCATFLLGLVALIWAPETKGKPLPE